MGCRIGVPTWFMLDWPTPPTPPTPAPAMLTAARLDWLRRMGWPAATLPPLIMATWVRDCGMLAPSWWLEDIPGGGRE